jgi:hypothetical protein
MIALFMVKIAIKLSEISSFIKETIKILNNIQSYSYFNVLVFDVLNYFSLSLDFVN